MTSRQRSRTSSSCCEICGLAPLQSHVGYPDGWVVAFLPARRWFTDGPGRSIVATLDLDLSALVGYRIFTCGAEACLATAKRFGVPGRAQPCGVPEIDAWLAENPLPHAIAHSV